MPQEAEDFIGIDLIMSSVMASAVMAVVLISSMTVTPASSEKMPSARPSMVKVMPDTSRSPERKTSAA